MIPGLFTLVMFVCAVAFFVLWLTKRPGPGGPTLDDAYRHGYRDGFVAGSRAAGGLPVPPSGGPPAGVAQPDPAGPGRVRPGPVSADPFAPPPGRGAGPPVSGPPVPPTPVPPTPVAGPVPRPAPSARTVPPAPTVTHLHTVAPPAGPTAPGPVAPPPPAGGGGTAWGLNSLLFVGSLLLIASGALFVVGSGVPVVKFVFTWLLVAALYLGGLLLHTHYPRLRPVALAFLGAGLGIVPFAGITFHALMGIGAGPSWTITSVIGVVAYAVAALRLRSVLVSYLTMAFVLSLAASAATTAGLSLVWSLVGLVVVATLASLAGRFGANRLPREFRDPVEYTGRWAAALALVAALVLSPELTLRDGEILLVASALQYGVLWFLRGRLLDETATRVVGHAALLFVASDVVAGAWVPLGFVVLGLAAAQQAYSLWRFPGGPGRRRAETIWLHAMQATVLAGCVFWLDDPHVGALATLSFAVLGVAGVVAPWRTRRAATAVGALVASLALPLLLGRAVIRPAVPWGSIALLFVAALAAVFLTWPRLRDRGRRARRLVAVACVVYALAAALAVATVEGWWPVPVYAALAAVLWVGSYRVGHPLPSWAGTTAFVAGLVAATGAAQVVDGWRPLLVAWIGGACCYAGHTVLTRRRDRSRAPGLLVWTWLLLAGGVGLTWSAMFDPTVEQAPVLGPTIVLGALTLALDGYRRGRRAPVEGAVYVATLGFQQILGLALPGANSLVWAHLWAAVLVAVAAWRRDRTVRPVLAAALLTVVVGGWALTGGWYQVLFLVEQLGLLTWGALTSRAWARIWGTVASVLAVLYLLRGFSFLALGFLGLVLIAVVMWRLLRADRRR